MNGELQKLNVFATADVKKYRKIIKWLKRCEMDITVYKAMKKDLVDRDGSVLKRLQNRWGYQLKRMAAFRRKHTEFYNLIDARLNLSSMTELEIKSIERPSLSP